MKKMSVIFVCVISFVSLVFSVICLCVTLPTEDNLAFDYYGVIIAVFSLLITILIGWNIYTFFDYQRVEEKLKIYTSSVATLLQQFETTRLKMEGVNQQAISNIYYTMLTKDEKISLEYFYLRHALSSMSCLSHTNDQECTECCNILAKSITEVIIRPELIKMSHERKKELLAFLHGVKNADKIPSFYEVQGLLHRLGMGANSQ